MSSLNKSAKRPIREAVGGRSPKTSLMNPLRTCRSSDNAARERERESRLIARANKVDRIECCLLQCMSPVMAHHVNIAGEAICPELDEKRKCFGGHFNEDLRSSSGSSAILAAMRRALCAAASSLPLPLLNCL